MKLDNNYNYKHLIGVLGPSTGGKSTLVSGICTDRICRVSFGDYLREVATERGWNGKKDVEGREFLQRLSNDLKRDHGESVFYDIGIQKALALPQPIVLFDDMRFLVEISDMLEYHDSHISSIVVIDEAQAEARWEYAALSRIKEDKWAWHHSEHEWRCVRHMFPAFTNNKDLGVAIGIERFSEFIENHIEFIQFSDSLN